MESSRQPRLPPADSSLNATGHGPSPEHGDLVPQHKELDVLGGGCARRQQHKPEHLLEDQVVQPQRHGGDRAEPLAATDHRWSAARAAF